MCLRRQSRNIHERHMISVVNSKCKLCAFSCLWTLAVLQLYVHFFPLGTENDGFLLNPDIVVSIISSLADSDSQRKIKNTIGKWEKDLLGSPSSASRNVLNRMVDSQLNFPASRIIQWMQTMGILFEDSGAAAKHPCYFVPAITSSTQWKESHDRPLPDFPDGCAELFIELRVPGTDTPPMPAIFFYQFVTHIVSAHGIDVNNLSVSQGCTQVKILSLKLSNFLLPCEALLSYDRLQCIIRIQLQ